MFDLDNTLYPRISISGSRWTRASATYVADFLKVSKEEAFRVQKDYYKRYGTTMRGMMTEHGMRADDYLDFVHKIDHSPLSRTRRLALRWRSCRGASSSSPTARASTPTR